MSKKVVAIIVTYNRRELLRECIEALLNQDYKYCDILIIDNASTDGTREYINSVVDNKKVIYINTGSNLGGAGGFNYGIKEAYKLGYDYMWIMDDDCIVHNDSLSELMSFDKKVDGNYGFLASKVLWKDNNICTMNVPRRTLTKNLNDFENVSKISMSSFVSLFIKRSIVEEFGLPIKEFFIWTDDWEYTRRISRKYDCYFVPTSTVTHKSSSNIGANIVSAPSERLDRFNYLYRNDYYLYKREGIRGFLYLYPRLLVHILRVKKSNLPDKKGRIKIIKQATKKGKKFNPVIEFVEGD